MQQACSRCGSVIDKNSRFCTNCGNVMENVQAYQQSWEASPAQNQAQVSSWAQPQGGVYQQSAGMSGQDTGGSLGFGGQSDTQAKQLLKIAGIVIGGAVLLLIVCIALAILIPIPGVRSFFLIVALLLILIPWMIYNRIRRAIRRTFGNVRRFL